MIKLIEFLVNSEQDFTYSNNTLHWSSFKIEEGCDDDTILYNNKMINVYLFIDITINNINLLID